MGKKFTKYGGNGKVLIDRDKGIAVKTLKDPNNRESKLRFIKELKILKQITDHDIHNLIEIIDIDVEFLRLTMPIYDGDLTIIYKSTIGNVKKCIQLLLPVVRALKKLSELPTPIYHRDLKPANILVKKAGKQDTLYIADFGCAYLKQEHNIRDTANFRAVGAQHFRAPEYDYGKVDTITEKGDIFSIGKLLWCMINGVKDEAFPYTLWFPPEYNLENRFTETSTLLKANLIIASCVDINAENRPDYNSLINMMENLLNDDQDENLSEETKLKAKKFEAIRKVNEIEIKSSARTMLNIFYRDMNECFIEIDEQYEDFELVRDLKEDFFKTYDSRQPQIDFKIKTDAASYIFSTSFRNGYLSLEYKSSYSNPHVDADKRLPFITCSYIIHSSKKSIKADLYFVNGTLSFRFKDVTKIYEKGDLRSFINELIEDYISG